MPADASAITNQIDAILAKYEDLKKKSKYDDCSDLDDRVVTAMITRISAAIDRFAAPGSRYLGQAKEIVKFYTATNPAGLAHLAGVLTSLREDIAAGYSTGLSAQISSASFIPVAIQESIKTFEKDHPNSDRVAFVMMQFADTSAHSGIESAIKDTLAKYGFTGLLARDKEYNEEMWANIQCYMHGCGFGIAVFERIQKDVFNPNVSLEVGYMLALKKRVLLLKDQTLTALQTDLVGRLYRPFDVQHPDKTIPKQVEDWMEEKGLI